MKAIGYIDSLPIDHADSLFDFEAPMPAPGPHDLLVRIAAVSVNPVDTKIRRNRAGSAEAPVILGWDAAGVVEAVGDSVRRFKPGDAVFYAGAVDRPGTNAEYHLVDEAIVGLKPQSLDFAQASALPLTTITAWEMLFDRFEIPRASGAGQALLVIGGAGGVGSIAVQLARRLTDLTVLATASRPESREWVEKLGAHAVIDHGRPLGPQLAELGHPSVPYVFITTNSHQHLQAVAEFVAPQGKVGIIEAAGPLDIRPFQVKAASIHWEYMFARSKYNTADKGKQGDLLAETARLIDSGLLQTTANRAIGTINAGTLRKAHAEIESGRVIGKLVLAGF